MTLTIACDKCGTERTFDHPMRLMTQLATAALLRDGWSLANEEGRFRCPACAEGSEEGKRQ